MIDISVIVVSYNSAEFIANCLNSVMSDSENVAVEIVVFDNASDDDTIDIVKREFPGVHLLQNEHNLGFAAGVNRGVEAAQGRILFLLNPDATLRPGSLACLINFIDENPRIGVVGARTRGGDQKVSLTAYGPYTPFTIIWQYIGMDRILRNWVFGRFRKACETATEPFDVNWVQGSCIAIRRETFSQIGGFDESFFLFAEETDFCTRAREAGWRVAYMPQAEVTHLESTTVSRYPLLKARHYHISPLVYFRKRGHEGAVLSLKIGFTLEIFIKSVIRIFQWIGRRDTEALQRLRIYRDVFQEFWQY